MKSKVHPTYKTKCRVANWPAYNQALVRCGDVTVWVSSEAIAAWTPRRSGRRGGQRRYSDLAIETALTLRLLYHLPLRQAEGFLHALFGMMRLDLSAPDYTTLSRRSQHLRRRLQPVPTGEGIHLVLDSTGLSIVGAGERVAAAEPGLILCAVRWYLRYSLSFRDVEELLRERGLEVDHTTIWRWIQRYGTELEERLRRHLKPTNRSWRVDETYVRVKGRWCYLYRAIDSTGATINFVLSGLRDAATAKRLFRKALTDPSHPQPRVINTDEARLYGSAIAGVKKEGLLRHRCRHRPVQYLNNIVEQDDRAIKRRVKAKQGFREFQAARRTLHGYEAMHMIRKGQVRWVRGSDVRRQIQFINNLFEVAA